LVWDLDTVLPFPCSFQQYAQQALQAHSMVLAPQYARWGGGGAVTSSRHHMQAREAAAAQQQHS
jgi:hypothetical protein